MWQIKDYTQREIETVTHAVKVYAVHFIHELYTFCFFWLICKLLDGLAHLIPKRCCLEEMAMCATVIFLGAYSAEAALCTFPKACHSSIWSPCYSQLFSGSQCCTCTSCRQTDVTPTAAQRSPKACAMKACIKTEHITACYFPELKL